MNISKSSFFKNLALSLFYLYSPLTSCKKSEKSLEPFLGKLRYRPTNQPNMKVCDFGLIWRPFREYLQNQEFSSKIRLSLFYLYSPLTSCKKSEKFLEPFLKKLRHQPTNQPTNYYQQRRSYRTWLTPVQQKLYYHKYVVAYSENHTLFCKSKHRLLRMLRK